MRKQLLFILMITMISFVCNVSALSITGYDEYYGYEYDNSMSVTREYPVEAEATTFNITVWMRMQITIQTKTQNNYRTVSVSNASEYSYSNESLVVENSSMGFLFAYIINVNVTAFNDNYDSFTINVYTNVSDAMISVYIKTLYYVEYDAYYNILDEIFDALKTSIVYTFPTVVAIAVSSKIDDKKFIVYIIPCVMLVFAINSPEMLVSAVVCFVLARRSTK